MGCESTPTAAAQSGRDCSSPSVTGDPFVSSPPRCLMFAGRPWLVKARSKAGATTNAWSDLAENVWVDADGLHLAITRRGNTWYAAEVTLNDSLGYGRYSFRTSGRVDLLDPNVVLGLFTYDYADAAAAYREIDIEYGQRLGQTDGAIGHFIVQPSHLPGHSHDFVVSSPPTDLWHHIDWREGRVTFTSGADTFVVTGTRVPVPGRENVRMNLWLFQGEAPVTLTPQSMLIREFLFAR